MATGNPLHRDTADRFNEENYNQTTWGTRNAHVQKGERNTTQRSASDRRRSRFAPLSPQTTLNETVDQITTRNQTNSQPLPRPKKQGSVERIRKVVAKAGSKGVGGLLYILIGFCAPVQMALGTIAGIALFIGAGLYTITDEASYTAAILAYAGVTPENFIFIYYGMCGLILVLNFIQIIIGIILFKAVQAHPIGGRGSTWKIITLLTTVIASFVPLLQIIPLIGLWVLAVSLYPR